MIYLVLEVKVIILRERRPHERVESGECGLRAGVEAGVVLILWLVTSRHWSGRHLSSVISTKEIILTCQWCEDYRIDIKWLETSRFISLTSKYWCLKYQQTVNSAVWIVIQERITISYVRSSTPTPGSCQHLVKMYDVSIIFYPGSIFQL